MRKLRVVTIGFLGGLLSLIPYLTMPVHASGTGILSIVPGSGSYATGATVSVDVKVNGGGDAVSAVSAHIAFNNKLTYVSASTAGSDFPMEVTPVTLSGSEVFFAYIRTDTGYTGTAGQVVRLNFSAAAAGTGTLTINPSTSDVVNYASASILGTINNGSFTIGSLPTVSSLGPTALVNGSSTTSSAPGPLQFTLGDADGLQVKYQLQIDSSATFASPIIDYTSALATAGEASFTVGQEAGTGSYTYGSAATRLPPATYFWRVRAIDVNGGTSSFVAASATDPAFRVSSPVISDLTVKPTSDGGVVTWTTGVASSSQVEYGVSNLYGLTSSLADNDTKVTSHSVTLTGLLPCTIYYYKAHSINAESVEFAAEGGTFITAGCTGSSDVVSKLNQFVSKDTGGLLELKDTYKTLGAFRLTIPAAFAVNDGVFQIKQLEKVATLKTTSVPAGFQVAGYHLYHLENISNGTTLVSTFSTPLSVSITYADADVTGLKKDSLTIYSWSDADKTWSKLSNCTQNAQQKTVSCPTSHFSLFALVGAPESSTTPTLPQTGQNIAWILILSGAALLLIARFYLRLHQR